MKAYQNLRKLDNPGRFGAWIFRIAHNEAYSIFRKRKPEVDSESLEPEATDMASAWAAIPCFPSN